MRRANTPPVALPWTSGEIPLASHGGPLAHTWPQRQGARDEHPPTDRRPLPHAVRAAVALAPRPGRAPQARPHRAARRPHRLQHHRLAAAGPAAHQRAWRRPDGGGRHRGAQPARAAGAHRSRRQPVGRRAGPPHAALPGLRLLAAWTRSSRPSPSARASSACSSSRSSSASCRPASRRLFGLGEDDSYYGTLVRTHGQPPAGRHQDRPSPASSSSSSTASRMT